MYGRPCRAAQGSSAGSSKSTGGTRVEATQPSQSLWHRLSQPLSAAELHMSAEQKEPRDQQTTASTVLRWQRMPVQAASPVAE
jgi:hypothetical protein